MRKARTVKEMVFAAALGVLLLGSGARAHTIYEIGSVSPGSPASPSDETGYLTTLISFYNAGDTGSVKVSGKTYDLAPGSSVPAPNLPVVTQNDGQEISGVNGSGMKTGLEIDLGAGGYDYALIKWGNIDEMYDIYGLVGDIFLNNDVNNNGESHFDLFTGGAYHSGGTGSGHGSSGSAPDGASTGSLLGIGFAGLSALRRIWR